MAAAVEPARPPPMIAMSVHFVGNPGGVAPVLRPERQIKASPGKIGSGDRRHRHYCPGKNRPTRHAAGGQAITIPHFLNLREALNPQTP
jgi:hypothetical protein